MKTRFKQLVGAAFALVASSAIAASGWSDDYEKALEQAKKENKKVLLDFTGSDWCGWCIKLDKEVFSKSQFKSFAKENLVLVEVDFPQGKRLPKKTQEQNEMLKNKFGIRGFPTLVVLDGDGNKVGQLGYVEGGPEAWIAKYEEVTKATAKQ
jgi:protein disulfide-isomerase